MLTVNEFKAATDEIKIHIKAAQAALDKAKAVSKRTGVPFQTHIADNVRDIYIPSTLEQLHPEVTEEFLQEVADIWFPEGGGIDCVGWQRSYC